MNMPILYRNIVNAIQRNFLNGSVTQQIPFAQHPIDNSLSGLLLRDNLCSDKKCINQ